MVLQQVGIVPGTYPSRKASQTLREQLVSYITTHQHHAGTPFFSDASLMAMSGLSRTTVRRALDSLQREGWIDRQPGKGSFLGMRAAIRPGNAPSPAQTAVTRVAVLGQAVEGALLDAYSQAIACGLDEGASENGIAIEVIGNFGGTVAGIARRLTQSRPDVLVVMPTRCPHLFAIAEAQRLNIPVFVTGTRFVDLQLPRVREDGVQGAAMAVAHLIAQGHRRIALACSERPHPGIFHRRQGYLAGLAAAGIEADERLITWLPADDKKASVDILREFLHKQRPTAMLLTQMFPHILTVEALTASGELRIPQDLSLISFDVVEDHLVRPLGLVPTTVELPLRQIGRRLAQMARELATGKAVADLTVLPCDLVPGQSVLPWSG
jgi:DNA-binding LacI/PurR family transcriptional regulator